MISRKFLDLIIWNAKNSQFTKKRSPALLPSFFLWCGKQDWILTARRRSVSAALRPHSGLIHYGFFKSCFCLDISLKKIKTSVLTEALIWCGKQDLNLHEIAFTRT